MFSLQNVNRMLELLLSTLFQYGLWLIAFTATHKIIMVICEGILAISRHPLQYSKKEHNEASTAKRNTAKRNTMKQVFLN